jgi:16S rRNA (cytidine1402-2'-O)-methyltransferase
VLGTNRRVVIARELTKLFESVHGCPLGEAAQWVVADEHRSRGEFVLIVEGAAEIEGDIDEARRVLEPLLAELPLKQAVGLAARITGENRSELYAMALEMKKRDG